MNLPELASRVSRLPRLPRLPAIASAAVLAVLMTACTQEAKVGHKLDAATKAYQSGDYAAAEIDLKNVLDLEPGNAQALKMLGLICLDQGNLLDAAALLQPALQALPEDRDVVVGFAKTMLGMGFKKDAQEQLLALLDRSPEDGEALILLADLTPSSETEWLEDVESRALKALEGGSSDAKLALAVVQLRQRRIGEAKNRIEEVLESDPENVTALTLMGGVLDNQKRSILAVDYLKRASELSEPRGSEPILYANLLMKLDRRDEAVEVVRKVAAETPDFLPAWRTLGAIAFTAKDLDEAEQHLAKVFAKAPLDIEATLVQAQIDLEQGEAEAAEERLDKLSSRFPGRPAIDLARARAKLATDQQDEAASILDSLLTAAPVMLPEALLIRSEIHLRDNQAAAAVTRLEDLDRRLQEWIARLDPEQAAGAQELHARTRRLLATAYAAADRPEDALALIRAGAAGRQIRQPEWIAAMPPDRLRYATRPNPARSIIAAKRAWFGKRRIDSTR